MTHRLALVSSYTTGTDLVLTLLNMVRYPIVDVLNSVTADRRLTCHIPIPYICLLVITRTRWLILKHVTHPPGRPPMPYIQTFVTLDLPSAS
jgi:hypothetical protein